MAVPLTSSTEFRAGRGRKRKEIKRCYLEAGLGTEGGRGYHVHRTSVPLNNIEVYFLKHTHRTVQLKGSVKKKVVERLKKYRKVDVQ